MSRLTTADFIRDLERSSTTKFFGFVHYGRWRIDWCIKPKLRLGGKSVGPVFIIEDVRLRSSLQRRGFLTGVLKHLQLTGDLGGVTFKYVVLENCNHRSQALGRKLGWNYDNDLGRSLVWATVSR